MVTIRPYCEETDAVQVGRLIADTYSAYNLTFAPPGQVPLYLGPFRHAHSDDPTHQEAIAKVIRAEMVFVAEDEGEIVGVLRGRKERLQSLFVRGDHHRQGIGRALVQRFEPECIQKGSKVIRVAATLLAVGFYLKMGYKKSTGQRLGWSFEGPGLPEQPMRKGL